MKADQAERVLAALRVGKTLRAIERDGIAASSTVRLHAAKHGEWAKVAEPLIATNQQAANHKKGAAGRSRSHCRRGHPLSGDNVRIERTKGWTLRRCKACQKMHFANPPMPSMNEAREVFAALHSGETISTITKPRTLTFIMATHRLMKLRNASPQIGSRINRLSSANAKARHAKASLTRRSRSAILVSRAEAHMAAIKASVPQSLPLAIRQDTIGAIALALIEGRLKPAEISSRAREFISVQWREFSKFGPASLDMPAFRDGATPLVETISHGLWQSNNEMEDAHA